MHKLYDKNVAKNIFIHKKRGVKRGVKMGVKIGVKTGVKTGVKREVKRGVKTGVKRAAVQQCFKREQNTEPFVKTAPCSLYG